MTQLLEKTYHGHGLSFSYPADWELGEESAEDAVTITVAQGAAFWSLTILNRRPHPRHVLEQATQAFRDEYGEVDQYVTEASEEGDCRTSANLEFLSLELVNCVFLHAVRSGAKTLFAMAQVTDHERAEYEPVFDAILAGLALDPEDDVLIA